MKILSAIGRFFARIGRWIKETAWIQPLLIVGAIFAVIFAIPHIIDGVKGWFNDSDASNTFYAQYTLSLKNADKNDGGVGSSDVDKFFTYLADETQQDKLLKMTGNEERFFVAFIQKDSSSAEDLYTGLKAFKNNWKNDEFYKGENGLEGKGNFKLFTIYTDTTNDDGENLFDMVWRNHYGLFEDLADGNFLPNTYYALNNSIEASRYASNFVVTDEKIEECPMSTPLLMYFDFTDSNPNKDRNPAVNGLSDVIFSVSGDNDLEKARTLKRCWTHTEEFGKIITK